MSNAHHANQTVRDPGPLKPSSGLSTLFLFLIVIGLAGFFGGLFIDKSRAWAGFLISHFYFLSLAIGGLFFASIQFLTSSMWSSPIRRISESFTAYLPVALVAFVILWLGGSHTLYEWTHTEVVAKDPLLSGKVAYLNLPFFGIRGILTFGLWILFAYFIIGNSLKQDKTKDYGLSLKNKSLSPIFLLVFGLGYTFMGFDLLMSLEPHWFSTIWGVYCFAGLFGSTLALTCVLAILLRRSGALAGIVNDNHLHDIGKFMFAFTVFWAYIGFSQFMLIWYANLPEETFWYEHRTENGWVYVSVALFIARFVVPFIVLLPRGAKRNEKTLLTMGIWMLACQFLDLYWIVLPVFSKTGPMLPWIELLIFIGFWGLFGFVVHRFMTKNNIVPIGDPRLPEAVFRHHV
jgi:hypothetical protein